MRLPKPWTVHTNGTAWWVQSSDGTQFGFCYVLDEKQTLKGPAYLSNDLARRVVRQIAKLGQEED